MRVMNTVLYNKVRAALFAVMDDEGVGVGPMAVVVSANLAAMLEAQAVENVVTNLQEAVVEEAGYLLEPDSPERDKKALAAVLRHFDGNVSDAIVFVIQVKNDSCEEGDKCEDHAPGGMIDRTLDSLHKLLAAQV